MLIKIIHQLKLKLDYLKGCSRYVGAIHIGTKFPHKFVHKGNSSGLTMQVELHCGTHPLLLYGNTLTLFEEKAFATAEVHLTSLSYFLLWFSPTFLWVESCHYSL